jgi:hypothetical protein
MKPPGVFFLPWGLLFFLFNTKEGEYHELDKMPFYHCSFNNWAIEF